MDFVYRDGKRVMEVLLLYNYSGKLILPSDFVPRTLALAPAFEKYLDFAVRQLSV